MAKKNDLVEIRLDRRQTFYAVVGSLLIVSVVFVVGLIIGQRMQIPQPESQVEPLLAVRSVTPAAPASLEEEPQPRPDNFTFYEELTSGTLDRPIVQLLPSADTSAPTHDARAASDPADPTRQGQQPNRVARIEPAQPGGEAASTGGAGARADDPSTPAADQTEASRESAGVEVHDGNGDRAQTDRQDEVANLNPQNAASSSGQTRSLQRRTVRRVSSPTSLQGAEDFGYFTVEVGVFPSFERANDVRDQLRRAGHEAIVSIVGDDPDSRRYRVQVGSFTRRSDAQATANQVNDLGLSARVVQEG